MKRYFYFGETVKDYDVKVLNEREARAGAGILFFFAVFAFSNAWFIGNFNFIKIFVTAFLIDFTIRVFINPKYAPSLILGRFFVQNQDVEYTGAPQKRFAWLIGFVLALIMFFVLVIFELRGVYNLAICLFCLFLLFFETAFGICIGCKMYNWFNKEKAKLCPGNACKIKRKEEIQKISYQQVFIFMLFTFIIVTISYYII
jgi:hypothetical protein